MKKYIHITASKTLISPRYLLILCILLFLISSCASSSKPEAIKPVEMDEIEAVKPIETGEKAHDFTIKTVQGDDFKFSDILGKKRVLLYFTSIFCQPCKEEIPLIKLFHEKEGKDDLAVVFIFLDGEKIKSAVLKYIEKHELDFLCLMDVYDEESDGFIAACRYGAIGTPAAFMIDKKGDVIFMSFGKVGSHKHDELEKIEERMKKRPEVK